MLKLLGAAILTVAAGFLIQSGAQGQNPTAAPTYTVVTVDTLDCPACAKRLSAKINAVSGVEKVQIDVEKKLVWIHPKAGVQLSPRVLWETIENAKDQPSKLQGPSGTFTAKPMS